MQRKTASLSLLPAETSIPGECFGMRGLFGEAGPHLVPKMGACYLLVCELSPGGRFDSLSSLAPGTETSKRSRRRSMLGSTRCGRRDGRTPRMSNGFTLLRASSRATGSCSIYEATHIGWSSRSISRKGLSGSNGWERIAIMTGSTSERSTLSEVKPIRSEADYEGALAEVERLWGARSGTLEGDRLDVLATLIDAYESAHHPIDPPDPIEAIKFRM